MTFILTFSSSLPDIIAKMKPSRESELFYQALEHPPADRFSFIESATQNLPELRENVLRRLALLDRLPDFLEKPYLSLQQLNQGKIGFRPGDWIGPYRVVKLLGLGGMGEVFLVEQETPILRRLALKVLKTSLARTDALMRLEAERQTLALMNHPNIARIIDGGELAGGSPYFVMEYVEGTAVTEFTRSTGLDIHQRLGLFLDVCEAIHHAHQKGVIHRDIKPSNILVTEVDGKPVPKVIDFGLAKWSSEIGGLKPYQTGNWRVLGTLPYVSPEQLVGASAGIDTRTDIYSLVVLLFELLTGVTPFENTSGSSPIADLELARRIREEEPPRPSQMLRKLEAEHPEALKAWLQLPATLAADLDWIVLKALSKSPDQRYSSVAELAGDIRNALASEPIMAGPPDWQTRVAKLARRHKPLIIGGAASLAMLLIAIAGLTTGLLRARQAEKLADQRYEQAHRALIEASQSRQATEQANRDLGVALDKSEKALQDSEKLAQFLEEIFQSIHQGLSSKEVRLVDVIQKATDKFKNSLELANANHARLFFAMGNRLFVEKEYKLAIEPFEMAWKIQSRVLGQSNKETINSAVRIGRSYELTGQLEKARIVYDNVLEAIEKSPDQGSEVLRYQLQVTKLNQTRILETLGDHDGALRHLMDLTRIVPENDVNLASVRLMLARHYQQANRAEEAIREAKNALAVAAKNPGPGNSFAIGITNQAGAILLELKAAEAEAVLNLNFQQMRGLLLTNPSLYKKYLADLVGIYEKNGLMQHAAAVRDEIKANQRVEKP